MIIELTAISSHQPHLTPTTATSTTGMLSETQHLCFGSELKSQQDVTDHT